MKELLYVCEADLGGIVEYAIRQSAAIAREGVEVHFLCKPSFPVERLAEGIKVWEFSKSREASDQRRGLAGKIFRVWRMIADLRSEAKQVVKLAYKLSQTTSTRHQLLVTRHDLGEAEVAVLFACYKEYFAPFWVGPLRRLAQQGVVIGTIAHDPVRDFVVGPLWWHRWSVRLGYSFVRHVFVHDDTPVDFGGKRPDGIEVHEIPHGPYEVAEPKIGRLEMRRQLGFDSGLTTELTTERLGGREMEQPKVGPKGEGVGTTESKSTEVEAWPRQCPQADASEPDSLPSKLADAPVSESLTRSTSGPTSALRADTMGSESAEGNQLADSKEDLEDQSQAGLQMDSQRLRSIHAANDPSASGGNSSSVPIREIRSSNSEALDAGRSTLDVSAPADIVFLAFGQIRDGKNLDLFLRAMMLLPENVKLLVAGNGDSGSSKPAEYYQKLAEELGVAERCCWDIRRIPGEEVGDIFAACDVVLVTYSAKFRSASGVLNAAVSARKPVLASSGSGPLKTVVEKYGLGVFVEPDHLEEILRGASKLFPSSATGKCEFTPQPQWELYVRENSWEENARRVCQAFES